MINYKAELYKRIYRWLKSLGISYRDYPLDAFGIASHYENLLIVQKPFIDLNVGGMLLKDAYPTMCLNANKQKEERNFDCMHELIHLAFHDEQLTFFHSSRTLSQNAFKEWEANEGAAEALAPYRLFIPLYCKLMGQLENRAIEYSDFIEKLSKAFLIPEISVHIRIKSLDYEIAQYLKGKSLNNIDLLSRSEKQRLKIHVGQEYLPYRFDYSKCT